MADVHLIGKVQQVGPGEHLVTVAVLPGPRWPMSLTEVHEGMADSRERAIDLRAVILKRVGATMRERGHNVVDVLDEG